MDDEALAAQLRALGPTVRASIDDGAPEPAAVATAVLDRIAAGEPVRAQPRRRRRYRLAAVAIAVLIAVGLTPPVRATVGEWLGFGGVVVRPGPSEPSASAPPAASPGLTLAEAADLVRFAPILPEALGAPDGVEVSADRRVLSLTWGSGDATVRLDQFDGRLSPLFTKTAIVGLTATSTVVGGEEAWWFAELHDLVLLAEDGTERTESARVAGPTLVWVADGVTLRLEGVDRARAVEIAESAPGT